MLNHEDVNAGYVIILINSCNCNFSNIIIFQYIPSTIGILPNLCVSEVYSPRNKCISFCTRSSTLSLDMDFTI